MPAPYPPTVIYLQDLLPLPGSKPERNTSDIEANIASDASNSTDDIVQQQSDIQRVRQCMLAP